VLEAAVNLLVYL